MNASERGPAPGGSGAPVLGCIADDFTGAADLGNVLVREGMRVVLLVGVPPTTRAVEHADAVVVALRSRTAPVQQAVSDSLVALEWLRAQGVRQVFFKYCSTFDSTDDGNIGPVADALADALEVAATVACPAFPETGRTVYSSHLFVGGRLLSESSMANHPLTPMHDPDLVRVLQRQTPHPVAAIHHDVVRRGPDAIRAALTDHVDSGVRHVVVDALSDDDLRAIGGACAGLALVSGGSGIARGLVANFSHLGGRETTPQPDPTTVTGPALILSGSSSMATREQVRRQRPRGPVLDLDPLALAADPESATRVADQAVSLLGGEPVMLTASAAPQAVAQVQAELGRDRAGTVVEQALGDVARAAVEAGARRVVVAGGETSAAVVAALGVGVLRIGPEIAPGVPWTLADVGGQTVALALKSGNFGGPDFFRDALGWWA